MGLPEVFDTLRFTKVLPVLHDKDRTTRDLGVGTLRRLRWRSRPDDCFIALDWRRGVGTIQLSRDPNGRG